MHNNKRLVHNGGYIQKLLQIFNSLEILWFARLYLVTKALPNLDRFYSILAAMQYFKLWIPAIMDQFVTFPERVYTAGSKADTCKNCAIWGKSFKIGTNEAYNIKTKIRVGGISKIFCFCLYANMVWGISLKKKFLKKFLLNFMN